MSRGMCKVNVIMDLKGLWGGWGGGRGSYGTVSLLCSVADFGVSGFKHSSFATRELVNL
jgi:hypothetical protein